MKKLIFAALTAALLLCGIPFAIGDSVDWSHPALTDLYSAWPQYVKDLARAAAKMDFSGDTNIPTGVIRYNASTSQLEKYNGATWDALTITNLLDGSVSTTAKMGTGVVTSTNILDATIANADIANATIQTGKIASATITGGNIASATVAGSNIASATITNANIASGTLTAGNAGFAWTSCSCPSFTGGLATISSIVTDGCGYMTLGKLTFWYFQCEFTVSASTTNGLIMTALPAAPSDTSYLLNCMADGNNGVPARLKWNGSLGNSNATIVRMDGGNWTVGSSRTVMCSGSYQNT